VVETTIRSGNVVKKVLIILHSTVFSRRHIGWRTGRFVVSSAAERKAQSHACYSYTIAAVTRRIVPSNKADVKAVLTVQSL